MKELTPKQEKFAQGVAKGLTQSDAYRDAYTVKETTKLETVNQASCRLMADSNISARVAVLREKVAKKACITLQSHLERLEELGQAAARNGQHGAAITAEIARAKAAGLLSDKIEHAGSISVTQITRKIVDV